MSLDHASQLDEETPLLQSQGGALAKKAKTPLPWRQFSMLLVLQIAEPLTSQVISPFAPQVSISHED
jgi:hypothetical protein